MRIITMLLLGLARARVPHSDENGCDGYWEDDWGDDCSASEMMSCATWRARAFNATRTPPGWPCPAPDAAEAQRRHCNPMCEAGASGAQLLREAFDKSSLDRRECRDFPEAVDFIFSPHPFSYTCTQIREYGMCEADASDWHAGLFPHLCAATCGACAGFCDDRPEALRSFNAYAKPSVPLEADDCPRALDPNHSGHNALLAHIACGASGDKCAPARRIAALESMARERQQAVDY